MISQEQHENRNQYNIIPTQLKKDKYKTDIYLDENGNEWILNSDLFASYHQPTNLYISIIRSIISRYFFGAFKVPNLKFMRKTFQEEGISEIIVNRYNGTLITDPEMFGTFNFCHYNNYKKKHKIMDVDPHNKYGSNYKYIGHIGNKILTPEDNINITILEETDNILKTYLINGGAILSIFVLIYLIKYKKNIIKSMKYIKKL